LQAERVFLGLGSNLGNRTEHLRAGLAGLRDLGLSVHTVSSLYLTEPVLAGPRSREGEAEPTPGGNSTTGHPWYLNCVASVTGAPGAVELLEMCLAVERQQGRERCQDGAGANGAPEPRTLDLDILLMGEAIVETPDLQIPHPRMGERRFVLQPLAEIAPETRHPVNGTTMTELLRGLPPGQRIWRIAPAPNGAM